MTFFSLAIGSDTQLEGARYHNHEFAGLSHVIIKKRYLQQAVAQLVREM